MPRFVVLIHDHPFPHWDLLLENGDACRTWRLLNDPASTSIDTTAEELPDHRLMYLDYEGPVSGDRGHVTRWDWGTFDWRSNEQDQCDVVFTGNRWRGLFLLRKLGPVTWKGSWSS